MTHAPSAYQPGIYSDMPEATYHADPCEAPSLSASIANVLLKRSPRHAWFAHPRLNPGWKPREPSSEMEDGSALHRMILGAGPLVETIDAEDWRTKAAKEARDQARANGRIPLLASRFVELVTCAESARSQIAQHAECGDALTAGQAEASIIWQDGPVWCRGRADWLKHDPSAPVYDLKTTTLSAEPSEWERKLVSDYAIQAAFYLRGLTKLRGVRPAAFRFIVVECEPPYGLSILQPDSVTLHYAEERIEEALRIWADCLETDKWPGYPPFVAHVSPPAWWVNAWEDRKLREEIAA